MLRLITGLFLVLTISLLFANEAAAKPLAESVDPKWSIDLPAGNCKSASLGTFCHQSSPAIADIDGDGRDDIVLATNNGHIVVVEGDGRVLWDRDTASLFGMSGGQQGIASSPAIADLDRDGTPEIVVGTGLLHPSCKPGGIVVLDNQGRVKPGWPHKSFDHDIEPANCTDPIFATPALGDLDNDGDLEIVAGGFDQRLYVLHHDGRSMNGFPARSHLLDLVGWSFLKHQFGDSIWSSPALADLDGDGYLDMVTGTDEGTPNGSHFTCPYRMPSYLQNPFCGGTFYALDRNGDPIEGFPRHLPEVIQSSPVIADADDNGQPEVYSGAGDYYHENSPDHPTLGFRMFGWDGRGNDLPGWQGGRSTSKGTPASAAVGDIAGDYRPEILIPGIDGRLYAWHADGSQVDGFPMTPRNLFGSSVNHDVGKSVVLADYDGDGRMEAFLTVGWTVVVVDGDGRTLTNTDYPDDWSTPFYYTDGPLLNNVAVGNIDGDGTLELVAQNSRLEVWDLPAGAKTAAWPMFRQNAARTGSVVESQLTVNPDAFTIVAAAGADMEASASISLTAAGAGFSWEASTSSGQYIRLPQPDGIGYGRADLPVMIEIPASLGPGNHNLGEVHVVVEGQDQSIADARQSVDVHLKLIRREGVVYLPAAVTN